MPVIYISGKTGSGKTQLLRTINNGNFCVGLKRALEDLAECAKLVEDYPNIEVNVYVDELKEKDKSKLEKAIPPKVTVYAVVAS